MIEFDLQRFDGEGAPASENTAPELPAVETDSKSETAQVDDVKAQIDAATKALKAELETERKAREAAAKKEAERLSKLSDDERAKAELENTRRELEQERANFEREKIKYEASKVLSQRSLPVEFTEYLIAEDNAKTLERITTFEKQYKKAIEAAVNERLKGKAPASGGKTVDSGDGGKSFLAAIRSQQIRR